MVVPRVPSQRQPRWAGDTGTCGMHQGHAAGVRLLKPFEVTTPILVTRAHGDANSSNNASVASRQGEQRHKETQIYRTTKIEVRTFSCFTSSE